jgi:uncharacterized protein (TIGR02145 family)
MNSNLSVIHYNNGNLLFHGTDSLQMDKGMGAWCDYRLNSANSLIYGHLYNYFAILDSRGLCPAGYRIPSLLDWKVLIQYMYQNYYFNYVGQLGNLKTFNGDNRLMGGTLKEKGVTHWKSKNIGANDTIGFKALPGGIYGLSSFGGQSLLGSFWTSTTSKPFANAYYSMLSYNSPFIQYSTYPYYYMASVRCMTNIVPSPVFPSSIIYYTADQTIYTADNVTLTADKTHS